MHWIAILFLAKCCICVFVNNWRSIIVSSALFCFVFDRMEKMALKSFNIMLQCVHSLWIIDISAYIFRVEFSISSKSIGQRKTWLANNDNNSIVDIFVHWMVEVKRDFFCGKHSIIIDMLTDFSVAFCTNRMTTKRGDAK